MPVTVELRPEYFVYTWPGRIKLVELVLTVICLLLASPAFEGAQTWFLLVITLCFLGTLFFSLYHLGLEAQLKESNVNWIQLEFWFTALVSFLLFTAWATMLGTYAGVVSKVYQYWFDAQVAAGVIGLFANVAYAAGTYFVYLDWRVNPSMGPSAGGIAPA